MGRSGERNHLILPDKEVSRWHGAISFRDGAYYYTDTSSGNGTDMPKTGEWIQPGATMRLSEGDILKIGEYELETVMASQGGAQSPEPWQTAPGETAAEAWGQAFPVPADWLSDFPEPPADDWSTSISSPTNESVGDDYPGSISSDWESFFPPASESRENSRESIGFGDRPVESRRETGYGAGVCPGDSDLFRCFLEGAGLGSMQGMTAVDEPAVMKMAGELLRTFVEGTLSALEARDKIKSEFRVARTLVCKEDNNLLKTASNVESVLERMLTPASPGFMDPIRSVQNALTDLMGHQLAVHAGWRAVLDAALQSFDPRCFEQACEDGIVFQKKAKCWDAYTKAYPELLDRIRDTVLAAEFAAGYERQMLDSEFGGTAPGAVREI